MKKEEKTLEKILKKYYGYTSFREGQKDIIKAILSGKDVLAVMPTGAGKSICFQIPAIASDGITLVISPLISLMKDQVKNLIERGIPTSYVNSTKSSMDNFHTLKDAKEGKYKILYVAPERLQTPNFIEFAKDANISIIAVDEAHCVSQWGHDFRPSYENIAKLTKMLDKKPTIAAFTATATDSVKKDIKKLLDLKSPYEITTGFDRENIYFRSIHTSDKIEYIIEYLNKHKNESGIIYCITRRDVEYVNMVLSNRGFNVAPYHAGLLDKEREKTQDDFLYDRLRAIVATNAFGMGIDKPNVSFVLHYGMPKNLEAYYQEAGRAGRDGELSEAVLLYNERDIKINEYMIDKSEENENLSDRERMQLKRKEKENLNRMVEYAKTHKCLRANMLEYFGEKHNGSCHNCSNCNDDSKLTDITIESMKILSSIKRMNENENKQTVIEVLRGIDENTPKDIIDKIYDKKYDELSTYQILKIFRKDISLIIDFLVDMKYLSIKGKNNKQDMKKLEEVNLDNDTLTLMMPDITMPDAVLKIEEKGYKVLKREKTVLMRTSSKYQLVRREKSKDNDVDEVLFKLLKMARRNIAKTARVPEFMVCLEGSLKEIAKRKPINIKQLMDIEGLGEYKAKKFGEVFISVVDTYKKL